MNLIPTAILYDASGNPVAVADGAAVGSTPSALVAGRDGTTARTLLVDASGRPIMVGAGAAGTPAGGVVSVQGVSGGTAVPVSGSLASNGGAPASNNVGVLPARATAAAPTYTEGNQALLSMDLSGGLRVSGSISATNPSVGTNNAAAPASSTQVGGSDGTNLQAARVFDADTGAGSQFVLGAMLRRAADGGSVETGVWANPLVVTSASPGLQAALAGFADGYVATATTTRVALRATTYTEQSSNAQRSLVSSSAADSAAGTGARTVKVEYLTSVGAGPFSEVVTMNGTTPVNMVATDVCFIESMEVQTVGSGRTNAGTISLRAATGGGGATIWTVAAGDGQTFGAHHYVPVGRTTYVTGLSLGHNGTVVGSGAMCTVNAIPLGVSAAYERQISDRVRLYGQSSTIVRIYGTPIPVVGPARLTMYVTPESSASLNYRGSFEFYEQ